MPGMLSPWRTATCGALIAASLLAPTPAAAQTTLVGADPSTIVLDTRLRDSETRSLIGETLTRVLKDPTTYALPPIVYTAHRLDWDSSQKVFPYGYVEGNPNMTVSGRANDVPLSHAAGNRRILRYSASLIGRSVLNNGICAVVERRLIERAPHRRKLIRTLGWIERGLVTAYWSYRLTHNQVNQWRENERLLGTLQTMPSPPAALR